MKTLVALTVLMSTTLVLSAMPAFLAHASSSEQVVFSGTGAGNFGGTNTPFGFWIWCEADSSNSYATECNGSMYFYALHLVKFVGDTAPIAEPSDGVYVMTVGSTDGTVACTLTNVLPTTHGPTNTVMVSCTSPAGSGASTSAVVNVTGPG